MPNPYNESGFEMARSFYRIHANSEQTHVVLLKTGERDYVAVAYDVHPGGYEGMEGEVIGYGPTRDGVSEQAARWMENNPRGVLGDGESSGIMSKIIGFAQKLNSYGDKMMDQQQTQGENQ